MTPPRLLVSLLLVAAIVGWAPPPPARSAGRAVTGTASIEVASGVLYDHGCGSYPYALTVDIPADARGFSLTVTLFGPDGAHVDVSEDHLGGAGAVRDEAETIQICDVPSGRYVLVGRGTWDDGRNEHPLATPRAAFHMSFPRTRTFLHVTPAHGSCQALTHLILRSQVMGPHGYRPNSYERITLQRLKAGHWVDAAGFPGLTRHGGRIEFDAPFPTLCPTTRLRARTDAVRWATRVSYSRPAVLTSR